MLKNMKHIIKMLSGFTYTVYLITVITFLGLVRMPGESENVAHGNDGERRLE